MSYTRSANESYSLAMARYSVSKITTDLKQVQRYYRKPSDSEIEDYREEAVALARHGYIKKVIYGFQRNGSWIFTLEYTAEYGTLVGDDRAGGVYRYANVDGADFTSYLWRSQKWWDLTQSERDDVEETFRLKRIGATAPSYTGGYLSADRTYSSQGTGFNRGMYRPL